MAPLQLCPRIGLVLVLLLMVLSGSAPAQTLVQEWVRVYDSGQAHRAVDLSVAPNGTIYVIGSPERYAPGITRVLAYDATGSQLWVVPLDNFWTNDVCVTASSCPVVAGGTLNERYDGAVVALDAGGDTLWTWVSDRGSADDVTAVATYDNHVFASIDCDNCTGGTHYASIPLHLDPTGNPLCFEPIWAWNDLRATCMAATSTGVYIAGNYDYDPPRGLFTVRVNWDCTTEWLYTLYSGAHGFASAIREQGDICSAGYCEFDSAKDFLLVRQFPWMGELVRDAGVVVFDLAGGDDEATALTITSSGECLTGYGTTANGDRDVLTVMSYHDEITWSHTYDGPGTGGDDVGVDIEMLGANYVATLATVDADTRGRDIVVLLYDLAGTYLGQVHYSGPGPGTPDVAVAMESDGQGGLYVAGTTGDDIILIKYRLSATSVDWAAATGPSLFLSDPWPNPSAGAATFGYQVREPRQVTLRVLDVAGRLVREIESGVRGPGAYYTSWDGRTSAGGRAPSGTYFLKLQADDHSEARAVTLIR